jgi:GAF domain-containing protein
MRIPFGKGVCGYALLERKTVIVDDVHKFEGHISCDPQSNSEIVIPLVYNGIVFGVLDIDSPKFNRFTSNDKELLEDLLDLLIKKSNTSAIINYYSS